MDLSAIYAGVVVSVLGLLLGWLLKVTTDTRSEVRKINGRLGKVEEWREGSTRAADERHNEARRRLEKLESERG